MSAKKQSQDELTAASRPRIGRLGRWLIATTFILVLGGGVSYAVWQQVREHVLAGSEYYVEPQTIIVSPQPSWIRTDMKSEVIQAASFDGPLSLLDSRLTVRLAAAFAAHPWVAHVERVSKRFPSSVEVVLTYRKPVAMVEVQGGALPIDIEATVLPSGDFTQEVAERYPRINEIHTTHSGLVGTHWADPAVSGAAQVAAALADDWRRWNLYRIVPAGRKPARSGFEYEYALYTRAGTRIEWGRAPGTDSPGELPVGDKVARLREFAAQHGSLDNSGEAQKLRFREDGKLEVQPRAPVKPLPKTER